jgi:hypothetical protein
MTMPSPQKSGHSTLEEFPDHVRAIGMISIENGNLEDAMAELFSRVIMVKLEVGLSIYMTPKAAVPRIEILENAAKAAFRERGTDAQKQKLAAALKRVVSVCGRAKALVGKRHHIIHDGWGVDSESRKVRRFAPGSPKGEHVAVSELEVIIQDCRRLIDDAHDLADELKASPPQMVSLRREDSSE